LQIIVKKWLFTRKKGDLMLIEFSVKNFKSIKERQTLSMVATKGGELRGSNVLAALDNKLDLVRTAAIYGPNASGKTNLVKAMYTMRKIVVNSSQGQRGDAIGVTPYLFDKETQLLPSEFSVTFVIQNVRYEYGFITTNEQVLEEWLLTYPKGRSQTWIDRKFKDDSQEYQWGNMDKLTGAKQVWQDATRPNALFLSTAVQLNNTQLQPVFDWFRLYIRPIPGDLSPIFTFQLCEDDDLKLEIIKFLQAADFHISGLELKSEPIQLDELETIPRKLITALKSTSNNKSERHSYDIKTIHKGKDGNEYLLDMDDESSGTEKFFTYAGPWLDMLKNGYVAVIDELNNNLHPDLVKFMVQMFHNNNLNRKNAQLIFTTHETSILSQEMFRRDQIWFTEKDEFNATTLYPLSDFSPRKGVENLEKNYLQGRYGGLPYLRDVANLFKAEA
jgi:AAA15 family ATPase/GTPase